MFPHARATVIALLGAFVPATGCSSGGSTQIPGPPAPGEFQFATANETDVNVRLLKNGAPVVGAVVELRAPYAGDPNSNDSAAAADGELLFRGGTNPDGYCRAALSLTATFDTVDVVVFHEGSSGPYTDESLRAAWGLFAPASRVTVEPAGLTSLTLELEDA